MRVVLVASLLLATGCKRSSEGLPPADDWEGLGNAPALASIDRPGARPRTGGQRPSNPHAGVPGAPPLDDMEGGDGDGDGDGAAQMDNPHAMGGVDVTQMGLAAPDPNRRIDPTRRLSGVLTVDPKLRDRVKSSGPIFLIVKRAGPDGQPTGTSLAVERLVWTGSAMAFELTEQNAMSAGTELTGDVILMARYDQDSEAMSKQSGDVTGQLRVKVPADKLALTLDTVVP